MQRTCWREKIINYGHLNENGEMTEMVGVCIKPYLHVGESCYFVGWKTRLVDPPASLPKLGFFQRILRKERNASRQN